MTNNLADPDQDLIETARKISLQFVGLGVGAFVLSVGQFALFGEFGVIFVFQFLVIRQPFLEFWFIRKYR